MRKRRLNCQLCVGSTRATRPHCHHPCHVMCFEHFRTQETAGQTLRTTDCPECMGLIQTRFCPGCGNKVLKCPGSMLLHCNFCYCVFHWHDRSRRGRISLGWKFYLDVTIVPVLVKTGLLFFAGALLYGACYFRPHTREQ